MRVNISVRDEDASIWRQATDLARTRGTSMSGLVLGCLRKLIAESAACTHCHGRPPAGFICGRCGQATDPEGAE